MRITISCSSFGKGGKKVWGGGGVKVLVLSVFGGSVLAALGGFFTISLLFLYFPSSDLLRSLVNPLIFFSRSVLALLVNT